MADSFRGFGTAVHDALNLAGNSTAFLPALEAVLASPDDDAALDQLATLLSLVPQPEALAHRIYRVSPVLAFYRHQREDPGWKLGTYKTRRELVDRLWNRAVARQASDPTRARDDARAALLLAAQDAFQYAPATVAFLVDQPQFDQLTQWTPAQLAALRELIGREQAISSTTIAHLNSAADTLESLIADAGSTMDPQKMETLLGILDQLVALGADRPHIAWRVANFTWRVASLARARSDNDAMEQLKSRVAQWCTDISFPHFQGWLSEAINAQSPPPKTAGFKRMTLAEFKMHVHPSA